MKLLDWVPGRSINFGEKINLKVAEYFFKDYLIDFHSNKKDDLIFSMVHSNGLDESWIKSGTKNVYFGCGLGYNITNDINQFKKNIEKIFFVRGPLTASFLDCEYVTDPAILFIKTNYYKERVNSENDKVMFTCHNSLIRDISLIQNILNTDFHVVSISDPMEEIIEKMTNTKLLISSALHAIIIADLMRIPWIPINYQTLNCWIKFKDYAYSLGIDDFVYDRNINVVSSVGSDPKKFEICIKNILDNSKRYLSDNYILSKKINTLLKKVEDFKLWYSEKYSSD
jgi:hypothetical protein